MTTPDNSVVAKTSDRIALYTDWVRDALEENEKEAGG